MKVMSSVLLLVCLGCVQPEAIKVEPKVLSPETTTTQTSGGDSITTTTYGLSGKDLAMILGGIAGLAAVYYKAYPDSRKRRHRKEGCLKP